MSRLSAYPGPSSDGLDLTRIDELWAQLPAEWRRTAYPLREQPFVRVFSDGAARLDLDNFDVTEPVRRELAWWVWHCLDSGYMTSSREVSNIAAAMAVLQAHDESLTSTAQPDPEVILRAFRSCYHAAQGRLPSVRYTTQTGRHFRRLQTALRHRYDTTAWWQLDQWVPQRDPRIPIRAQEPAAHSALNLALVQPVWLREALRYYGRVALDTQQIVWGTLLLRFQFVGRYFGDFAAARQLPGPALVADPLSELHPLMGDYLSHLRSLRTGRPNPWTPSDGRLAPMTVVNAQRHLAAFYAFAVDHRVELAKVTGERGFLDVGEPFLRIWRPGTVAGWRHSRFRDDPGKTHRYIDSADLGRMVDHVDLLGLPRDHVRTVALDGQPTALAGLGDPSAMRAWLLQALTGRRASEILLCDFQPLSDVPGLAASDRYDPAATVARFRYQQTKIDGAPTSILVGADVVAVIVEQQAFVRDLLGSGPHDPPPPRLFPALRHNPHGSVPRSQASYKMALGRLTKTVQLRDRHGQLLEYSKSHRLRHTKATTLLNLGAPVHVVMRYLGHVSPEMTMHYAATLASTAEREFLRTTRVGRDGRELTVDARDLYEMVTLDTRTDRILPTGVCLLPPAKRCDRGNACYSCSYFATDTRHLDDHRELLADTLALIQRRTQQHQQRTGHPMSEDNVWLAEQQSTVRSLQQIIASLEQHTPDQAISGAGIGGRAGYQSTGPIPIQISRRPGGRT